MKTEGKATELLLVVPGIVILENCNTFFFFPDVKEILIY